MKARRVAVALVALLLGTPVLLFWFQNAATRVNLIFKLTPNLAWDLGPAGMSLPALLLLTVIVGMLISALWVGGLVLRGTRRVKLLERQVTALQDEIEFNRRTESPKVPDGVPAAGSASFDDLL